MAAWAWPAAGVRRIAISGANPAFLAYAQHLDAGGYEPEVSAFFDHVAAGGGVAPRPLRRHHRPLRSRAIFTGAFRALLIRKGNHGPMRKSCLAVVLCAFAVLLAAPAAAQQVVTITANDCRRVVAHVASADVEYRPGVDVRGGKVAPADVGGGPPIRLPDEIAFDIKVDLRNFLGGPDADGRAASAAVTAADDPDNAALAAARTKAFTDAARIGETLGEPVIGRVRIKGFRVYFNDRLLGDMAEAELARKCREMLHRINRRN